MNNLVPEKRVDKNGVLTTKHVRASKASAVGRTIPAPSAPRAPKQVVKTKEPIKRQQEVRLRHMSVARHEYDEGLMQKLGVDRHTLFKASDAQIYSVMHVADAGNTLLLLKAGIRTAEEGMEKLDELGLGRLMEDNSILAKDMLGRRIHPETYYSCLASHGDASPNFLDYVEYLSIDALFDYDDIGTEIRAGSIKISDVKALGAGRIKKSDAHKEVKEFLVAFANGTTNTTMSDAKIIFDKYATEYMAIHDALIINSRYGSEFGTVIEPEAFVMGTSRKLTARGVDDERIAKVIKYGALVRKAFYSNNSSLLALPSDIDLLQCHDAGVPPEEAAQGMTPQQWDAMQNNGIAPSVSGGWL